MTILYHLRELRSEAAVLQTEDVVCMRGCSTSFLSILISFSWIVVDSRSKTLIKINRIPLTFEVLTPRQACAAFSKGVGRKVTYQQRPIEITCPIPAGYKEHLEALEETLGTRAAPYFGPTMYYPNEAIQLWEGNRGLEEYAREIFPEEERANGLTWMDETDSDTSGLDAKSAEEARQEAENSFMGSC